VDANRGASRDCHPENAKDVAKWFEDCVVKKRGKREQMRDILLVAQRNILKLLYECEFKNF